MSVAGEAAHASQDLLVMGRVTTVYGIKGWVKVYSFTDPMTNILNYRHWYLRYPNGQTEAVKLDSSRVHGKGLIALFSGCADRNEALRFAGADILVNSRELPEPESGEYYWYQLEGLAVITQNDAGEDINLGKVHHLMETGSNDVLSVRGARGSIDRRERLIPWIDDQVIQEVNLDEGFIRVDWDPDF